MTENAVISIDGASYAYGDGWVLENVNLKIFDGEFTSIVGPNGGGKTTLLRLMLGLLKPQRGSVRVMGGKPEDARDKLGYMPQHLNFDPLFPVSVMDIVLMGRLQGMGKIRYSDADRETAQRCLRELDAEHLAKRQFADLSGGQRQRVLLARTLTCQPKILLLDEPTANVDLEVERSLYNVLLKLNERMTILVVSHDLSFVSKSIESVICVNRNVVRHQTSEITPESIRKLYRTDMRVVLHDSHIRNGRKKNG